jgi:hypothetical protein
MLVDFSSIIIQSSSEESSKPSLPSGVIVAVCIVSEYGKNWEVSVAVGVISLTFPSSSLFDV